MKKVVNFIYGVSDSLSGVKSGLFWMTAVLFIVIIRIPLFLQNLQGEEGLFAFLSFYDWPPTSNLIAAIIDEKMYFIHPEHPMPVYYVFRFIGKCIKSLFGETDSRLLVTGLRAVFSVINASALILMCAIVEKKYLGAENRGIFRLSCIAFISMLYVSFTSAHIQTEGSAGLAFFCLAMIMLVYAGTKAVSIPAMTAGLIIGLGKNEWTLIFIASVFIMAFLQKIRKKNRDAWIVSLFAGLIAGNIVSYLIEPGNYTAGYDVILRIFEHTGHTPFKAKLHYAAITAGLFMIPGILTGLLLFGVWKDWEKIFFSHSLFVFSAICAAGIIAAYLKVGWTGGGEKFPRYFVISFPFIIIIFGNLSAYFKENLNKFILTIIALAAIILNLYSHLTFYQKEQLTVKGQSLKGSYAAAQKFIKSGNNSCLYYTGPDAAFYMKGLNFANKDLGEYYLKITKTPLCFDDDMIK